MVTEATYESLRNLNASSAKHATWCVRVIDPKVIHYNFKARGELVPASKFCCLLVTDDPDFYVPATVLFNFNDKEAAAKAEKKFRLDSVWKMKKPQFDPKADRRYISSAVHGVVLLNASQMTEVTALETALWNKPARFLNVGLSLKQIVEAVDNLPVQHSQAATSKAETKNVDLCGKVLEKGQPTASTKNGTTRKVMEMVLADETGSKVTVSVWDKAIPYTDKVKVGAGVVLVGVSAMKDLEGTTGIGGFRYAMVLKKLSKANKNHRLRHCRSLILRHGGTRPQNNQFGIRF